MDKYYKKNIFARGFTLIEMIVVLAVFSFVSIGAATAFISAQRAWTKARDDLMIIENARWVMERITVEVRHGSNKGNGRVQDMGDSDKFSFGLDFDLPHGEIDKDTERIWYVQGKNHGSNDGEKGTLYRSIGTGKGEAMKNKEIIAKGIAETDENDDDYDFFDVPKDGIVNIKLVFRKDPQSPDGPGNRSFVLLGKVRGHGDGE